MSFENTDTLTKRYKPEKTDFTRALKKTGKTEINWPFVLYSSDSGGTPCRQSCSARSMTSSTGRSCVFLGWLHLWFLPADRISLVTTDFYRLFVQPTHLRSLEQRACVVCKRNRVSIQKTASLTRWLIHLFKLKVSALSARALGNSGRRCLQGSRYIKAPEQWFC